MLLRRVFAKPYLKSHKKNHELVGIEGKGLGAKIVLGMVFRGYGGPKKGGLFVGYNFRPPPCE